MTKVERVSAALKIASRKMGTILGRVLHAKLHLRVTKVSKEVAAQLKAFHKEGEDVRATLSVAVAQGVHTDFDAKAVEKTLAVFAKWDKRSALVLSQAKPFLDG